MFLSAGRAVSPTGLLAPQLSDKSYVSHTCRIELLLNRRFTWFTGDLSNQRRDEITGDICPHLLNQLDADALVNFKVRGA